MSGYPQGTGRFSMVKSPSRSKSRNRWPLASRRQLFPYQVREGLPVIGRTGRWSFKISRGSRVSEASAHQFPRLAHQFHLCFDKSKKSRFPTERAAFGAMPQVHGMHVSLLVESLRPPQKRLRDQATLSSSQYSWCNPLRMSVTLTSQSGGNLCL